MRRGAFYRDHRRDMRRPTYFLAYLIQRWRIR